MQIDITSGRMMKALQNLAGFIGIGIVCVDDPDYADLCEAHRTISSAHRRGDYTTILTTLDRDYFVVRLDRTRQSRKGYAEQLRSRMEDQIQTDYREEPAHIVIRGKRAQIATRIYSNTICRRDGKLIELQERAEHLTVWTKTTVGWRRLRTRIRSHEQNTEWIDETSDATIDQKRTEKYLV